MKGIFNIKNWTKNIPKKWNLNYLKDKERNLKQNFINQNITKNLNNQKKPYKFYNPFQNLKISSFFDFGNMQSSLKFNLSQLIYNYFYRVQFANFEKNNKDFLIFKLSGDKNNMNGENKNINNMNGENKNINNMNIKFNGKKSDEDKENDQDNNQNNNNKNNNWYIKATFLGIGVYIVYNYITEFNKEKSRILISVQEFMDKISNNSIQKIGLVFHDDNTNLVNVYGVDKDNLTFKIQEEFDKEIFLKKIEENSHGKIHNQNINNPNQNLITQPQINYRGNSLNTPNIVYEYDNESKQKSIFFLGFLTIVAILYYRFKKISFNSFSKSFKIEELSNYFNKNVKDFKTAVETGKKEKVANKVSKIKFSDVAGLHTTKKEVMEFVEFLKHGEKFANLGARIPRGALFTGPPGTGKTLLAKAIAGEADVNFYSASGSEFQKMYVGEGAADIRKLFAKARENSPAIIFIDEIDSIGKKRDSSRSQIRDDDGILNQLLVEMDGFETDRNVIVFAATNRADMLDSALLRSGRFDRKIEFSNPNPEERQEILKLYLQKIKLDFKEKIEEYSKRLAQITSNFSGADLANMVNEAAIISARESKESVDKDSFAKAFDRVYYGIEKKKPNNKSELNHISIYESAKVACSWFLENVKPIIKVSILPKTKSRKNISLNEDKVLFSKEELFERIILCLSGRVAEEHYLGTSSTLSAEDLFTATTLAEKMMKNFGMSKLGHMSPKNFGEKNMTIIDEEIKDLLKSASQKSKEIIIKNSDKIIQLRDTLLIKQDLDYDGIKNILGPLPKNKEEPERDEIEKVSASI